MFNDATALVAFTVALAAVMTGKVSGPEIGVDLVLAVLVGTLLGVVLGVTTKAVLSVVHDGYAETTLTVLAPFLAYVGAERFHGSGVLAVLALGAYTCAPTATPPRPHRAGCSDVRSGPTPTS